MSSSSSTPSTTAETSTAKKEVVPAACCYKTILFDVDGVLAEVSQSYRAAIVRTCHIYGATSVTDDVVTEWKIRGNANNDWVLSRNLILSDDKAKLKYGKKNGGEDLTLEQVTQSFEDIYQGKGDVPGLYKLETLIPSKDTLRQLHKMSKAGLGVVTGRPRSDCLKFLRDMDLMDLFDERCIYCAEDGPSKPDPFPVRRVCETRRPTRPDRRARGRHARRRARSRGGRLPPEAAAAQVAKGEPHTHAPLSVAMAEAGADLVPPPGFAELVDLCAKE